MYVPGRMSGLGRFVLPRARIVTWICPAEVDKQWLVVLVAALLVCCGTVPLFAPPDGRRRPRYVEYLHTLGTGSTSSAVLPYVARVSSPLPRPLLFFVGQAVYAKLRRPGLDLPLDQQHLDMQPVSGPAPTPIGPAGVGLNFPAACAH